MELLKLKNVHSYGYGFKDSGNKLKDTLSRLKGEQCIKVFVEKKIPEGQLKKNDIIPKEIDGIKTDVEETPELIPLRNMERPVVGGCSGMLKGWTACTIGGVVFKGDKPYLLSNEHCFDRWFDKEQVGTKIMQPSPFDGGTQQQHEVATLVNTEHRLVLDGKTLNEFDTSIQPLDAGIPYKELFQKDIGQVKNEIADIKPGEIVQKRGRTTGYTTSHVIATNVVASVRYGLAKDKLGMFKNQIFTRNVNWGFVNGGDSGSLVFDMEDRCIGNLFAGSEGENGVGVISPIAPIMQKLDFTFEPTEHTGKTYYAAMGEKWYIAPVLGDTMTLVKLNVRTAPIVNRATLVKTLPVGAKIKLIEYVGVHGNWHWCKIIC
jgi:hypothetical protein